MVYDVGEEAGRYFFAMQYVEGCNLADLLQRRERLDLGEALPLLAQVAAALDYAHEHGFIHRDVKPENVLLSDDGRGGWLAKVTDFGIARAVAGTRLTRTGALVGTPEYMSPEQAQGQAVDRRSDVYSLGIVAYEVLTSRPPFRAERETDSPISVILKHVQEAPVEPLTHNPNLPAHVNHAIMKALQKNPAERFATAGELVRALAGEVPVEPSLAVPAPAPTTPMAVTSEPPTETAGSPSPVRRSRWLAPVSGALTVVTGALSGGAARLRSRWLAPALVALLGMALLVIGVLHQPASRDSQRANEPTSQPSSSGSRPPAHQPTNPPANFPTWTNPVDGMEFFLIPGGDFQMGSPGWQEYCDECPQHRVHVDSFYLGKYEVTNAQWKKFVDAKPEWRKDRIKSEYHVGDYLKHWNGNTPPAGKENHPVEYVSWYAAKAYCEWAGVRLPTEAEWEYAAQGGKDYEYGTSTGGIDSELANYGWNEGDTTEVGKYPPNPFGIYDLVGNVWEWCSSEYKPYPYQAKDGREDLRSNIDKVVRGGTWFLNDNYLGARDRDYFAPASTSYSLGLRCARAPRP
jgi:serine/threonine-protein kinase